jgi:hypothetical protein
MENVEQKLVDFSDGAQAFGRPEQIQHFITMWNSKTRKMRSAMFLEPIAARHLELLVVNPGTVIVCAPTMDSTLACFKWAVQNVKGMDTEIHRLPKQVQHTDTL